MLATYDLMAFAATAEPAAARAFYEGKLGLTVLGADDYGVMYAVNGRRLRLSYVQELQAAPYSILCWVVPDIRVAIAALTLKEVVFERYDGFGQDAAGIWASPDGTLVAWFKDPGGNVLSLAQFAS
jgi:catechol 2,3-dioxygenase-like lactoylglutathione lyase family enzyme